MPAAVEVVANYVVLVTGYTARIATKKHAKAFAEESRDTGGPDWRMMCVEDNGVLTELDGYVEAVGPVLQRQQFGGCVVLKSSVDDCNIFDAINTFGRVFGIEHDKTGENTEHRYCSCARVDHMSMLMHPVLGKMVIVVYECESG